MQSPCKGVCNLDKQESFCTGCFRSLEEIQNWLIYSSEERDAIMSRLQDRSKALVERHSQRGEKHSGHLLGESKVTSSR